MSWQPVTDFDYAVISMQPDHNFIYGQLEFEQHQKKYFTPTPTPQPAPKASKHVNKRKTLIETLEEPRRSQIMQDKLVMMEKIQQITGTKPFGEHASLADWDKTDNIESEAIAMMRHFGMMSMVDGDLDKTKTLPITVPTSGVYIAHNGKRRFPVLLDTKYFEPKTPPDDYNNGNEDNSRGSSSANTCVHNSSASGHNFSLKSLQSASISSSGMETSKEWNLNNRQKHNSKSNQTDDELNNKRLNTRNCRKNSQTLTSSSDDSFESARSNVTGGSNHFNDGSAQKHTTFERQNYFKNGGFKDTGCKPKLQQNTRKYSSSVCNENVTKQSSLAKAMSEEDSKSKQSKRPNQKGRLLSCHELYNLKRF